MGIKNNSKIMGQLLIDLTPLLDVIFIFLIVVLTYQTDYAKNADEMKAEAQRIMQEAEARTRTKEQEAEDAIAAEEGKREALQEHLSEYENLYDSVNIVTIYASYKPSNIKFRTVYVQIGTDSAWEKEVNPSNEEIVWAECQSYIEDQLAGSDSVPTLFSIKNEKMLYRDEQSILSLYEKLNIEDKYLKNHTETEDE